MRRVAVVTGSRADYGILRPVLQRIQRSPSLVLQLLVTGMHLSVESGRTVSMVEADGMPIAERIAILGGADTPEAVAVAMGNGTAGFARAFARLTPDLLVLVGDRFETHAAAVAALPFNIPVAHLHGGELSEGAVDDAMRHSITKLSHLHFVSTGDYARRVIQLGEEPWRVVVSGAPSLDQIGDLVLPSPDALAAEFGISMTPSPLLVTLHPVTRARASEAAWLAEECLAALTASRLPIVFTQANADPGGQAITAAIRTYVAQHPQAWLVDNLGTAAYFGLMAGALAMVGNSSSGLIEAPSFTLPVVNIGNRQHGRVRAANVVDVADDRDSILGGIRRATTPEFRRSLGHLRNPYRCGNAASIIVERLETVALDQSLVTKHFCDLTAGATPALHA